MIKNFKISKGTLKRLSKLKYKLVGAGAVALATIITITTVYVNNKKEEIRKKHLGQIMIEKQGETCFDEIIRENVPELPGIIEELDDYIELSEEMHKLDIDRENTEIIGKLKSPAEIRELISFFYNRGAYKNNPEKVNEVMKELVIQEALVNQHIYTIGYPIMQKASRLGATAAILDATGRDATAIEEISWKEFQNTGLTTADNNKIFVDEYEINRDSNLGNLIEDSYTMQNKGTGKVSEPTEEQIRAYNKNRNTVISNTIHNLKVTLLDSYSLKGNKVVRGK